jgi:anti-sigma-K factor RskA
MRRATRARRLRPVEGGFLHRRELLELHVTVAGLALRSDLDGSVAPPVEVAEPLDRQRCRCTSGEQQQRHDLFWHRCASWRWDVSRLSARACLSLHRASSSTNNEITGPTGPGHNARNLYPLETVISVAHQTDAGRP